MNGVNARLYTNGTMCECPASVFSARKLVARLGKNWTVIGGSSIFFRTFSNPKGCIKKILETPMTAQFFARRVTNLFVICVESCENPLHIYYYYYI